MRRLTAAAETAPRSAPSRKPQREPLTARGYIVDLIYIGFAAVFIGIIAHVRGRSGIGWFLLAPLLAFVFSSAVYFYLTNRGTGELAAMIMVIPFLYGSPVATFLLLVALGRPKAPAERSAAAAKFWGDPIVPAKVDPLAAMTRGSPMPEPHRGSQ